MFAAAPIDTSDKTELYAELAEQARGLLHGERDRIANAANFAALVYHALPDINWCGFYLFDGNELVVGPFQGKPACIRIALGKGVCGTAAATRQTQLVRDVNAFDGHIACDGASRSEIVVPLFDGEAPARRVGRRQSAARALRRGRSRRHGTPVRGIHGVAARLTGAGGGSSDDTKIRNVGPKSAAWLRQVGVRTHRRSGPRRSGRGVPQGQARRIPAEPQPALFDGRRTRRLPLGRSARGAQAGVAARARSGRVGQSDPHALGKAAGRQRTLIARRRRRRPPPKTHAESAEVSR